MAEPFDTLADDLIAALGLTGADDEAVAAVLAAWGTPGTLGQLRDALTFLGRLNGLLLVDEPPSNVIGAPGAFAIDQENKVFYGPKDAITGWPAGEPFLAGPIGATPNLTIGSVTTSDPGDPAEATLSGTAEDPVLDLTLPRGDTGPTPNLTIGSVTTGAAGSEAEAAFTGTPEDPVLNLTIPQGDTGAGGDDGWSPVLAIVTDGVRRVHRVVDWTGGTGAEPIVGLYVGATGLVSDIADAVDVRGPQGSAGSGTGDMLGANNLSDLTDDAAARTNLDVYSKAQVDSSLSGKSNTGHTHAITDVTGLQTALDGKSGTGVTAALDTRIDALEAAPDPAIADVTGLQTALDERVQTINGVGPDGAGNVDVALPATAATYTYTAGVLTSMTEVVGGTNRVSTFGYTAGVLTTLTVVHNGVTRTTTYSYTAGVLTGSSTVES